MDRICCRLNADSFENVGMIASEGLEKWAKSGSDSTERRGLERT
ncbi:hypothetical protein [Natrinema longum]|nr:hypothetical protein [Natrinema longum]